MVWGEDYSVGDTRFDDGHKIIMELIGVCRDTDKRDEMETRLRELHERHSGGDTGVAADMIVFLND
ncbi:MAG: hypothetical protein OXH94_04465 [Rhodospirillales bacterium]|nr:hypothetical protein [Rhodospirillales bacterium]